MAPHAARLLWLVLVTVGMAAPAAAQIRVMHWNVVGGAGNMAALTRVLAEMHADDIPGWAQPIDIMTFNEVDEITSNASTSSDQPFAALTNAINASAPPGVTYALARYTNQSENGVGGAQAMYYRSDRFTEIVSGHRDIFTGAGRYSDRWQLQLNGHSSPQARFYVYGSHLKASSGSSNENERNTGMVAIRNDANALGADVPIIYTGDFNIYTNTEPAYQTLVAPGNGQGVDPYGAVNWTGASGAVMHTQSPLLNSAGGLVGGGLDDRFDFIMPNAEAADGRGISMLADTMRAVGNDGQHYNKDINSGNNFYFPGELARSNALADDLWVAADHIPQLLEFQVPARLAAQFVTSPPSRVIRGTSVPLQVRIQNVAPYTVPEGVDTLDYALSCTGSVSGSASGQAALAPASTTVTVNLSTATAGAVSGSVLVSSSSEAVEPASVSLSVSALILRPSNPSLDLAADLDQVALTLPDCEPDSGLHTVDGTVRNVGYDSLQSRLDVDSVQFSGIDAHRFSMPLGLGPGLAGTVRTLRFAFDSAGATPGTYASTATIRTSDEGVAGEQVRNVFVQLTATVGSGMAGDLDGSGTVDAGDIALLLLNFGACSACPEDLDGSGEVDSGDIGLLLLLFN
ncbi:MAG: hypothetical protein ACO32J_04625 [Phycisphaerales bacterium]